jgi:hypothetical protein
MFHLVKDNVSGIENNLIWAKSFRDSIFSWWFNVTIFVIVIGLSMLGLVISYGSEKPPEIKQIPFKPNMWHNAVKNVPLTNYGQTPQVEAGDGIQGFARRNRATDF